MEAAEVARRAFDVRSKIERLLLEGSGKVRLPRGMNMERCLRASDREIIAYALFLVWRCPQFWATVPEALLTSDGKRSGATKTQLLRNLRADLEPFRKHIEH